MLEIVDYVIVVVYILTIVVVGTILQKKASANIESFFLGNREIPWWALAASGIASNFDISGTAINAAMLFALGFKGFYVEFRGGVTLGLSLFLVFGKWTRRSETMTVAEWMRFRFGDGRAGKFARLIFAIGTIVLTVFNVTYFAIGSGKFVSEFLGIGDWLGLKSTFWSGSMITGLALIYTVASGLYGVVWTDVLQGIVIFFTGIALCIYTLIKMDLPSFISVYLPPPHKGLPSPMINISYSDWSSFVPVWDMNLPNSGYSSFNLITLVIIFYIFKAILEGTGGPSGYTAQRYLSAKSDKAAGNMTLLWIFLLSFRWPFTLAIALLGLTLNSTDQIEDPEKVLSRVIDKMLPSVMKGFMVSGLLAAGMSTFDSNINAGAAYYVKDIYQSFINPSASPRTLIIHSRVSSLIISIIGVLFSLLFTNINDIWGFLTIAFGASFLVPLISRWFYWRVNGWGFGVGTIFGMLAAVIQRFMFNGLIEWISLFTVLFSSLVGLIFTTVLTSPTEIQVLCNFYKKTRPPGFWGPVTSLISQETNKKIRKENIRDIITAYFITWPFQVFLFMSWMNLLIFSWIQLAVTFSALVVAGTVLYFFFIRHLGDPPIAVTELDVSFSVEADDPSLPTDSGVQDPDGKLIDK